MIQEPENPRATWECQTCGYQREVHPDCQDTSEPARLNCTGDCLEEYGDTPIETYGDQPIMTFEFVGGMSTSEYEDHIGR